MSLFEIQYLATQYTIMFGQLGLLIATIYFYRKLVANDNLRIKSDLERDLVVRCKNIFRGIQTPGELQSAGNKARTTVTDNILLIVRAYEEIRDEFPKSVINYSRVEFIRLMEGYEPEKWKNCDNL